MSWLRSANAPRREKSRRNTKRMVMEMIINKIALAIAIIGALNWGSIGLFSFDIVAWISGGATSVLARIIYIVVALAGIWCISLLFHRDDERIENHA